MRNFKLIAVAIAVLATPVVANAEVVLQLSDGTNTVTVGDNSIYDLDSTVGNIAYFGKIGTWNFNLSGGIGNTTYNPFGIDLTSQNSSTEPGTLIVKFTETGLNYGPSGQMVEIFGDIGGTTQGSVLYSLYADQNNDQFGTGTLIFTDSASSSDGSSTGFSDSGSGFFNLTNPFSLTASVTITHMLAGKTTSFDFSGEAPDPIPEPGTLALLSLGLLGAGVVSRRRKTQA